MVCDDGVVDGETQAPRPWVARTALALLVLATPVATWWLVGDLDEELVDPDYLFRPLALSETTEVFIGVTATALVAVSALALLREHLRRPFTRRRCGALACLLLAGLVVGGSCRVLTAGVGGANIGGGMVMMFGPFIVGGLVVWAIRLARPPRHPLLWTPPDR